MLPRLSNAHSQDIPEKMLQPAAIAASSMAGNSSSGGPSSVPTATAARAPA